MMTRAEGAFRGLAWLTQPASSRAARQCALRQHRQCASGASRSKRGPRTPSMRSLSTRSRLAQESDRGAHRRRATSATAPCVTRPLAGEAIDHSYPRSSGPPWRHSPLRTVFPLGTQLVEVSKSGRAGSFRYGSSRCRHCSHRLEKLAGEHGGSSSSAIDASAAATSSGGAPEAATMNR